MNKPKPLPVRAEVDSQGCVKLRFPVLCSRKLPALWVAVPKTRTS